MWYLAKSPAAPDNREEDQRSHSWEDVFKDQKQSVLLAAYNHKNIRVAKSSKVNNLIFSIFNFNSIFF